MSGPNGAVHIANPALLSPLTPSCMQVVGVVIADPLYRWAMTPVRAKQRQHDKDVLPDSSQNEDSGGPEAGGNGPAAGGTESLGNADAERAVLRVKQKLEGLEWGEGGARSVAGQVSQLLDEAQDPQRLCRMYAGWAAWM